MASKTERITVLVSPSEKRLLVSKAQNAGISVSEYLRRAANYYSPCEEEILEALVGQMRQATQRAVNAIDKSLEYVAESNERIAAMEANAKRFSQDSAKIG